MADGPKQPSMIDTLLEQTDGRMINALASLARQQPQDSRDQLYGDLILRLLDDADGPEAREKLLDLVTTLVPLVPVDRRIWAIDQLLEQADPPGDLAIRLARDDVAVVRRLLLEAPLCDADLMDIIFQVGRAHHLVIAQRADLTIDSWLALARAAVRFGADPGFASQDGAGGPVPDPDDIAQLLPHENRQEPEALIGVGSPGDDGAAEVASAEVDEATQVPEDSQIGTDKPPYQEISTLASLLGRPAQTQNTPTDDEAEDDLDLIWASQEAPAQILRHPDAPSALPGERPLADAADKEEGQTSAPQVGTDRAPSPQARPPRPEDLGMRGAGIGLDMPEEGRDGGVDLIDSRGAAGLLAPLGHNRLGFEVDRNGRIIAMAPDTADLLDDLSDRRAPLRLWALMTQRGTAPDGLDHLDRLLARFRPLRDMPVHLHAAGRPVHGDWVVRATARFDRATGRFEGYTGWLLDRSRPLPRRPDLMPEEPLRQRLVDLICKLDGQDLSGLPDELRHSLEEAVRCATSLRDRRGDDGLTRALEALAPALSSVAHPGLASLLRSP